jgi:hypothetical protein
MQAVSTDIEDGFVKRHVKMLSVCLPAEVLAKHSLNYIQFKYVNQVECFVIEFLFGNR